MQVNESHKPCGKRWVHTHTGVTSNVFPSSHIDFHASEGVDILKSQWYPKLLENPDASTNAERSFAQHQIRSFHVSHAMMTEAPILCLLAMDKLIPDEIKKISNIYGDLTSRVFELADESFTTRVPSQTTGAMPMMISPRPPPWLPPRPVPCRQSVSDHSISVERMSPQGPMIPVDWNRPVRPVPLTQHARDKSGKGKGKQSVKYDYDGFEGGFRSDKMDTASGSHSERTSVDKGASSYKGKSKGKGKSSEDVMRTPIFVHNRSHSEESVMSYGRGYTAEPNRSWSREESEVQ